jgi:hypothetical protein
VGPYEVIGHVVREMGKTWGKAKGVLESVVILLYLGEGSHYFLLCDTPYRLLRCIMC